MHYDCVSIQQQQPSPVHKPTADEDGYIIPMRMKSSPSFSSVSSSSVSSGQRHSLTSFQPAQEGPPSRRSSRLSGVRQSRQDLHVKLEDHYGTVTGANFQALAQLLEQVIFNPPGMFFFLFRFCLNWNALDCDRRRVRDPLRPTFTSCVASRVKI